MPHEFGGAWTEIKLAAVGGYLQAFNTALRSKPTPMRPFTRLYIDAFAGSGDRELSELPLFDNDPDINSFAKGSVRIALDCDPAFDRFHLIEKNAKHLADLKNIAEEYSQFRIDIHSGDANEKLVEICQTWDTRACRGVLFIDPYGCQVEWSTLEAVAATKSIDVWLLCPVNAIRRMLQGDGQIDPKWRRRLTRFFGTDGWYEHFYKERKTEADLLEYAGIELERRVTLEGIESYYRELLQAVFNGGVSNRALRLGPRGRDPLFSLFFACSNPSPKARRVAFNIANHLIRKWDG